jgi:hypothetical protein
MVESKGSLKDRDYAKISLTNVELLSEGPAQSRGGFVRSASLSAFWRGEAMIVILLALICGVDGSMNEQVVEYARSKLGERVGDGECSSLAAEALRHAGAKVRRGDQGSWGEELKSLLDAKPGDILQFEGAAFSHTSFRDDGAKFTQMMLFPHHTAIVARVRKRGAKPVLVVLHQNVGETKVVQEWTINIADKKRGTVKLYRPVARESARPRDEPEG